MVGRPRFSILMPTHSRMDVIGHAIQSVLDQTEQDFELLVVGDGCVDGTGEVVAGFGDPRIRFFDLPKAPHFGYANRNVALREAQGAMIAFASDDDLLFPDHLEQLGRLLDGGSKFAYSQALWVSTDGVLAPLLTNLEFADELQTFMDVGNSIPANCVVYRADSLPHLDAWPEDVSMAADWVLWRRIIRENQGSPVAYCRAPTVLHFSARRKNARHSSMPAFAAMLDIADSVDWWPADLRVAVPEGSTEQAAVATLMQADLPGWAARIRLASADLVARVAWEDIRHARPTLKQAQREAVVFRSEAQKIAGQLADSEARRSADTDALTKRLAELARERDDLSRRLAEIRASTSWRMTGPLRAAVSALRRLR
jgi:glycosyltransferase involved in cell wall biosynthesis